MVIGSDLAPGKTRANTLPISMLAQHSSMSALNEADFKPDVIYQVVLDRFFDGDPTNNDPPGDNVFITGNVSELGNWSPSPTVTIGPMMDPHNPSWFLMVSVPACKMVSFKFIIIHANGSVKWESGNNHTYTVSCSGVVTFKSDW